MFAERRWDLEAWVGVHHALSVRVSIPRPRSSSGTLPDKVGGRACRALILRGDRGRIGQAMIWLGSPRRRSYFIGRRQ